MRRYATILFDFIEEAPAQRSDKRVDPHVGALNISRASRNLAQLRPKKCKLRVIELERFKMS
jgi:hypothetical protein